MVADQPLDATDAGHGRGLPGRRGRRRRWTRWPRSTTEQGRGFELRNVAGGWRYYTRDEYAAVVEGFVLEGQQARLTQAALETLAVVAYKQPVSRARVSAIRGVNVDGVMRTLLTRGLVEEAGQDHETGANLYRTTTLLPGADRRHLDRRAARAGAVPARHGRPRGRAWPRWPAGGPEPAHDTTHDTDSGARPRRRARRRDRAVMSEASGPDRRRRADPAPEAAGHVRRRLAAQVRGADARGQVVVDGEVVTRLGHQGRPHDRGDPRRRQAAAAGLASTSTWCSTSRAAWSRRCRTPRAAARPQRPRRRPPRAALPRRPARHRHLRAVAADQRRRLRPADGAPVLRGGQDLRRRGRRRGHQGDRRDRCSTGVDARGRPGHGLAARGSSRSGRDGRSKSIVELVIHEGRNRIVRRLLDHVGHPVRRSPAPPSARSSSSGLGVRRAARPDPRRARRAAGQRQSLRALSAGPGFRSGGRAGRARWRPSVSKPGEVSGAGGTRASVRGRGRGG